MLYKYRFQGIFSLQLRQRWAHVNTSDFGKVVLIMLITYNSGVCSFVYTDVFHVKWHTSKFKTNIRIQQLHA